MVDERSTTDASSVFVVGEDVAATPWIASVAESTGHDIRIFANADTFLNSYNGYTIGCVICDVRLPGMSGLELLRRLAERSWDIPVVMMSDCSDVQTAILALKSGAFDFVEKKTSESLMLDLIHSAVSLHNRRSKQREEWTKLKTRFGQLTPREFEVMQLVVEGLPNKAIAIDLGVSTKTVEAHRAHVMKKMKVRSLPDLVRMTIRGRELQDSYNRISLNGARSFLQ